MIRNKLRKMFNIKARLKAWRMYLETHLGSKMVCIHAVLVALVAVLVIYLSYGSAACFCSRLQWTWLAALGAEGSSREGPHAVRQEADARSEAPLEGAPRNCHHPSSGSLCETERHGSHSLATDLLNLLFPLT